MRGSPERDISSLRALGPGGGQISRVVHVSARAAFGVFAEKYGFVQEGHTKKKIRPSRKEKIGPGRKQKIRPKIFNIFHNIFYICSNVFSNLLTYILKIIAPVCLPRLRLSTRAPMNGHVRFRTLHGQSWEPFKVTRKRVDNRKRGRQVGTLILRI